MAEVSGMIFIQSYSVPKYKYSLQEKAVLPSINTGKFRGQSTETRESPEMSTEGRSEGEVICFNEEPGPQEQSPFHHWF